MSSRTALVLGLIVVVCVAVIVVSGIFGARSDMRFGLLHGDDPSRAGPFGDGDGQGLFSRLEMWGLAERTPANAIASSVAAFGFLYISGALTLLVVPRNVRLVQDAFGRGARENLRLFGVGALTTLALAFLTVVGLLVIAVVVPVPLLLPFALIVAAWIGLVGLMLALGRAVGRWAGRPERSPLLDLAIGALAASAVGSIPFAGRFIFVLLLLLSVGAAVATRLGTGRPWSLNEYHLDQGSNS